MRKAILVGVSLSDTIDFKENIEEMKNLAQACAIEVVHTITQSLRNPHKQTYINSGKVAEIKTLLESEESIDLVLFDCELAPSQQRNLIEHLDIEIVDKTNLILQIFEQRAQTKEAKLQVEVAKLKYILPRLAGSYDNLDRQRGGDKNRGAGEKKIEIDIRNITHQIHCAEKELKEIAKNRETQRRQRKKTKIKSVALVGYTNAGKSSIMNALMERFHKEDKKVFEKDMLFATLTTNTRNIHLDNNHQFLISDTVGFVSDLPHNLIKAFHSTLEEVVHADLLIHVIDLHNPEYRKHKQVSEQTLANIDAGDIEVLNVYNKCDLRDIDYPTLKDDQLYISAKDEQSITMLIDTIGQKLFNDIHTSLLIPYEEGALISTLNTSCKIISQAYKETGVLLTLSMDQVLYEQVKQYEIK
ncbi:MAG: GTPase HflX [Erysipelotrichia bacterium]|nr:GTPase HflX [Erysipelotrichia bacterium]